MIFAPTEMPSSLWPGCQWIWKFWEVSESASAPEKPVLYAGSKAASGSWWIITCCCTTAQDAGWKSLVLELSHTTTHWNSTPVVRCYGGMNMFMVPPMKEDGKWNRREDKCLTQRQYEFWKKFLVNQMIPNGFDGCRCGVEESELSNASGKLRCAR